MTVTAGRFIVLQGNLQKWSAECPSLASESTDFSSLWRERVGGVFWVLGLVPSMLWGGEKGAEAAD